MLNWPGDGVYLRAVAQNALLPCVLVWLLCWWLGRADTTWCRSILGLDVVEQTPGLHQKAWNWVGLVFLVGVITFLEVRQPFYFTQDDNATGSLPVILVGCRTIWQGEFPSYNPYLFLGAPLAGLGIYALTYPPLLGSYAIARHVLQQEYATLEVFCILHLVGGFVIIRLLGRKLGMAALSANLAGLSCVLSGSALIMGRSWFNFTPIMVWLPLLFLGLARLMEADRPVGWKWIVGMGLAMAAPFHVGFSQLAAYINGFFCLAVAYLLATGGLPRRSLLPVLAALLIGAAIALPIVSQQWRLARSVVRLEPASEGIVPGLPAFLLPYPLVEAELPTGWGNDYRQYLGQFYFFGGMFAWLFLFQVTGLVIHRPGRKQWAGQIWLFCAVVALWLGLGDVGGLWPLFSRLPGIGFILRYPMRMMPFVVFFVPMTGGMVLDRLLRSRSRRTELVVGGSALALLLWHALLCLPAFYVYHAPIYPKLPTALERLLWHEKQLTGRVACWAPESTSDSNFFDLLPQNVPAVYGLPIRRGLDPLLSGSQPKRAGDFWTDMRVWGVAWHFIPDRPPPLSSVYSQSWKFEVFGTNDPRQLPLAPHGLAARLRGQSFAEVFAEDGVVVKKLTPVDPLAFAVENDQALRTTIEREGLPIELHGSGIDVNVGGLPAGHLVIVNFRHWPDMTASVDGQAVACLKDPFERIIVRMPAAGETLSIRYHQPWASGIWLGVALAAAGGALGFLFRRKELRTNNLE